MLFNRQILNKLSNRKKENNPTVRIIEQWDKSIEKYASGVLIEVTGGKGILREEVIYTKDSSHFMLVFEEQPLVQLQGDEYFCPTCEKILKSAYSLEQAASFREKMYGLNETTDFITLVKSLVPFWGLLEEGYYILLDTKLYPTDGNGHLFWNVPNWDNAIPGTCIYYYGNLQWGDNRPYFTVATQPYSKHNPARVNDYMKHPQGRALAYYMDGYITALIDGHHKALAAAKSHQMLDALVIMPCYDQGYYNYDNEERLHIERIGNGKFIWDCVQCGLNPKKAKRLQEQPFDAEKISQFRYTDIPHNIEQEMNQLATYYPDVHGVACIEMVGELTDHRLNEVLSRKEIIPPEHALYFVKALIALKHPRTIELFDFFLHKNAYYEDRIAMVKEIAALNTDGNLTDYLIEVMVEFEEDYPDIKDIILKHI